jgi:hypothetical protein
MICLWLLNIVSEWGGMEWTPRAARSQLDLNRFLAVTQLFLNRFSL